jgi:hypothetical protein
MLKFSFAYNTPGLNNGLVAYTPAVGEILLNAWIDVTTAFDGTTPKGDIGTFVGVNYGLFSDIVAALGMNTPSGEDTGAGYSFPDSANTASLLAAALGTTMASAVRGAPGRFTATNPVKVVVSQDGTLGGTAVGGTAGAATLYLEIGTATVSPG